MLDPFAWEQPAWLQSITDTIVGLLNLPTLRLHLHEVLLAFAFYHFIFLVVSPTISPIFIPQKYAAFNERTRRGWDVHVVSFVQSSVINTLALYVMWHDEERWNMDWRGRIWGYTGGQALVQAMATGYFVWDTYICARYYKIFGLGMLAHGISALFVFGNGFRPFVNYYGPSFILYELSSPFLNIHWFLDKLNRTGSDLQLYNGILLMASFFSCRLCWGSLQTYRVFSDIWKALEYQDTAAGKLWLGSLSTASKLEPETTSQIFRYATNRFVPRWLGVGYLVSNAILNMLNLYWFNRMVATIRARFEPPFGTKRPEKILQVGRGIDENDRHSVEVDATEVRKRTTRRKA